MSRYLAIVCLIAGPCCETGMAQGPLQRKKAAALRAAAAARQLDEDSVNRRSDVEGTIWEFKVLDNNEKNKSKRTEMSGRIRIKQSSVFAVGNVEMNKAARQRVSGDASQMVKVFDNNGDEKLDASELSAMLASIQGRNDRPNGPGLERVDKRSVSDRVEGEFQDLVLQKIKKSQEEDIGGERIGDLTISRSSEKTFRFDEDDKHPLSGMVVVKQDTAKGNGVWVGRYDEVFNGKKKTRWRFEMRKIEE